MTFKGNQAGTPESPILLTGIWLPGGGPGKNRGYPGDARRLPVPIKGKFFDIFISASISSKKELRKVYIQFI
jgi:hypothetical protein